ncbi:probable malonyl-CoA-acyl carrier protein transacylase, mitochondrial [Anopheles bellator]|uniref:probable malonyl-CoA-acyl carrier protein transacylase, mitochondrial n=1 Tax=Anopheles bellator TaxID=139047 RepID=UPI0026472C7E|nr:probable malonyl-CoA-acyl carrier protein transacylase, mitochondrial [Anopheles bellator]
MLFRVFHRRLHRTLRQLGTDAKVPPIATGDSESVKKLLEHAASFEDLDRRSEESDWATLPYVAGTYISRDQSKKAVRPTIDPRETNIIVFPGQGSQYVGMGSKLLKFPGARDIFALANEVLGYDLLKICIEGPKSKLDQTKYCQPAVMVTSLAALEQLREERPNAIDNCFATAGFSLGELTALIFAGAIPFDKGVRLVQIRAEAMQLAAQQAKGAMATALFGADGRIGEACNEAKNWCIDRGIENPDCRVANYLYPGCKVLAGNEEALRFLEANLKRFNIRRLKRLPVSGAFHTELMEPAVEPFAAALRKIRVQDPSISVHSNVDGKCYRNAGHIVSQLPKQIVRPVKWEQTLHILYERKTGVHFPRTFECGPGKGLKAILKQVNAKAWDSTLNVEA